MQTLVQMDLSAQQAAHKAFLLDPPQGSDTISGPDSPCQVYFLEAGPPSPSPDAPHHGAIFSKLQKMTQSDIASGFETLGVESGGEGSKLAGVSQGVPVVSLLVHKYIQCFP